MRTNVLPLILFYILLIINYCSFDSTLFVKFLSIIFFLPVAVGEDSHAEGRERPAVLGRKIILAEAAVFFAAPTSPHDCVSSRGNRPRRE